MNTSVAAATAAAVAAAVAAATAEVAAVAAGAATAEGRLNYERNFSELGEKFLKNLANYPEIKSQPRNKQLDRERERKNGLEEERDNNERQWRRKKDKGK